MTCIYIEYLFIANSFNTGFSLGHYNDKHLKDDDYNLK